MANFSDCKTQEDVLDTARESEERREAIQAWRTTAAKLQREFSSNFMHKRNRRSVWDGGCVERCDFT